MKEQVSDHYGRSRRLIDQIADRLKAAGVDPKKLCAAEFGPIDEFHFRGRQATLQLLEQLKTNLPKDQDQHDYSKQHFHLPH